MSSKINLQEIIALLTAASIQNSPDTSLNWQQWLSGVFNGCSLVTNNSTAYLIMFKDDPTWDILTCAKTLQNIYGENECRFLIDPFWAVRHGGQLTQFVQERRNGS